MTEIDKEVNAINKANTVNVAVQTDNIAKLVVENANSKEFVGKDEVQAKELTSSDTTTSKKYEVETSPKQNTNNSN